MKQLGVMPDEITFIGLLAGCSHSGMITEGFQLFDSMVEKYGVSPNLEHYACVVDLLSRAGELRQAHGIVKGMPFKLGASVMGLLLNGCLIHRNIELRMEVMKLITERRDGEYMMMANMCAVAGYHEEATEWRDKMRENGVIKKAGYSMIEIDGKQ
ncbi:Pentatricopeptide repeat-containing protein [Dendrobium catenatum]|uniref:Pentatricopeptide repeat-containing protein n=1 Tax=Dendrobium catenatum TaxID=906689 RepID=A0A2I0XEI3_9ASPA|nr:Pentatricopeptide repeat-containing protein [Dendrobium catenatum]